MFSAIALSLLAHVVTVTATDYHFDAPATIPAGVTTIELVNRGQHVHHLQLIRVTVDDASNALIHAFSHPGPLPSWATFAGGPNGASPGETSTVTVVLEPGSYFIVCFIPDSDHVPHILKGMIRPLTVSAVTEVSRVEPRADLTLTMTEFAFALSAPVTPGVHTLRVENQGTQDHEALLVRLAPGKGANDLVAWSDHEVGPRPAKLLAGLTVITHGSHAYFTYDFTPGRYALLCFAPDAATGQLHVAKGMIREITVP